MEGHVPLKAGVWKGAVLAQLENVPVGVVPGSALSLLPMKEVKRDWGKNK